jgi:hypothetical protein
MRRKEGQRSGLETSGFWTMALLQRTLVLKALTLSQDFMWKAVWFIQKSKFC